MFYLYLDNNGSIRQKYKLNKKKNTLSHLYLHRYANNKKKKKS